MERPELDHRWRLLLAVCGVAIPLFGVLHRLELPAEPAVSSWMRVAMSGCAFTVLALSYVDPRVRARLRLAGFALAYWVQGWFIYTGAADGMGQGRVVGILLISSLTAMLFRSNVEIVAFTGFTTVVGLASYAGVVAPEVGPGLFVATMATAILVVGAISVSRPRLEHALFIAQADLEDRVRDRTAELAASLRCLEIEVEERKAAECAAHEANQAKSTFLANMSHELRTPLNAIVGYTELVGEEIAGSNVEHLIADLERVRASAGHLLRLIDGVLDLSRVESGKLVVHPSVVDVGQVVHEVVLVVDRAQPRNGNRLLVDVAPGLALRSDPQILRQIVANLLSNAVKFTADGEIRVVATPMGAGMSLSVVDTGIGIPESAMGRLFQKFGQVDDSPTRRHGGTGLGLALCRELAVRLGGTLTVRSKEGEGSTFTLELPAIA